MKRLMNLILLASLGALAACSRIVITPAIPMTPTPIQMTSTPPPVLPTMPPPSDTPGLPTDTPVSTDTPAAPTATVPATPTLAITSTATAAPGSQALRVFLIAVNDNGKAGKKIGCGDSAVAVTVMAPHTAAVLRASLEALLAIHEQNYGEAGLYNALYQSDLRLKSLALVNGTATIYLTGTLKLGGECDNPRVQAQLEETALQFSTVKHVVIYLNGQLLAQALSLK